MKCEITAVSDLNIFLIFNWLNTFNLQESPSLSSEEKSPSGPIRTQSWISFT